MARGTVAVLLAEALAVPAGLIATILLAGHLPTSAFGALTLSITGVAWLEWSVVLLLSRTAFKLVAESPNSAAVVRAVVRAYATLGVLVGLLVIVTANAIAQMFEMRAFGGLLQILALDIPLFVIAQGYRSILVGRAMHGARAIAAATRWTIRAILVAAGVAFGASVEVIGLLIVCATAAELVVTRMQLSVPTADPAEQLVPLMRLFSAALPVALSAIAIRLLDRMDIFALRMLGGSLDAVAAYGVAQNLALGPALFTSALVPTVIAAVSSRWHVGDTAAAQNVVHGAMRAALLLIPLVFLGAAAAPMLIATLFSNDYSLAAPIFRWLVIGAASAAIVSVGSAVLVATGHTRLTVVLTIPLFLLALAGFVVVAPSGGATGIAAIMASTWAVGAVATTLVMHKVTAAPFPFGTLARAVIFGVASALVVSRMSVHGVALFAVLFLAMVLIAVGMITTGELPPSMWRSLTLRRRVAP